MARLLGIVLFVLAIWIGVEVATHGTQGAFGGVFASEGSYRAEGVPTPSAPKRAAEAFQRAYDESEKRVDRALAE